MTLFLEEVDLVLMGSTSTMRIHMKTNFKNQVVRLRAMRVIQRNVFYFTDVVTGKNGLK